MVQQIMIHKIFVEYGVTRIGDYSFYLSQANSRIILYNLDIANTVTSIGKYAFWGQALEEIIIPPTVTDIGKKAFGNMEHLSRIVCYADPKNLNWDNIVDAKDPKTEVHVLTGERRHQREKHHRVLRLGQQPYLRRLRALHHRRQVRQRQKIRHLRQRGLCHLRVL